MSKKKEKEQPKYIKDQKVQIILGKNKTNPAYKYLIKHDSQHGIIDDAGYIPASGKNIDFAGVYLYRVRIGTIIVSDIPEQVLEDASSPNSKRYDHQL
ncbi:MAG: hypothetical protein NTZ34_05290 [Chloroflexi bacterium]|nr:hypothetical protein [Chloroflexota bacterium]